MKIYETVTESKKAKAMELLSKLCENPDDHPNSRIIILDDEDIENLKTAGEIKLSPGKDANDYEALILAYAPKP